MSVGGRDGNNGTDSFVVTRAKLQREKQAREDAERETKELQEKLARMQEEDRKFREG